MSTNTNDLRARMHSLIAAWVRTLGVEPLTAQAHPRRRDVWVAVETATTEDAIIVAAALRLACAADVRIDPAEDGVPPMACGAFTDASLAALTAV